MIRLFLLWSVYLLGIQAQHSRTSLFSYDLSEVSPDPDVGKDMVELVQTRGYVIESHFVTTADGYILNMFRIPQGKNEEKMSRFKESTKPPVILQHGLLDSSFTWINNYEDQSLGYILADAGFDVWFGNNRGNRYGRNHTTLDPDDGTAAFWSFSWDEMASQDLPAMIHYVLDATGAASLGWVGHSEGTIQMFAAASDTAHSAQVADAISKVNLFVALAPVAYVYHLKSRPIQFLAQQHLVEEILSRDIFEIGKWDDQLNELAPKICTAYEHSCELFLDVICGPSHNLNESRIQVYVSGTPAGTSTQNFLHWEQGVLTDTFQKFDYGSPEANAAHYDGATVPPLYDLSAIPSSFKIAMFSGDLDYLADVPDVGDLLDQVPAASVVFDHVTPAFAHLDFTWAYNANSKVYKYVTDLLVEYAQQ